MEMRTLSVPEVAFEVALDIPAFYRRVPLTVPEGTIGPTLADLAGIIDDIEHGVDDHP